MFNKKLCITNIYQLAKERGIKIGDLEKTAGASTGYLSRLNKDDNTTVPTIDFIAAVSEALGVTVDAIIKNDYTSPTPTEKYILSFIDRLLSKTNTYELDWEKDTPNELYAATYDHAGLPNHPLFIATSEDIQSPPSYKSSFASELKVTGDCFRLSLPGSKGTTVYLMCVGVQESQGLPFTADSYELYVGKNWELRPLCRSLPAGSLFCDCLAKLYATVKESCNHPKLDAEIMTVIDAFMNGTTIIEDDVKFTF